MEELENEISTQAEENTVSLASAQALADALAKIEVYTPTTWVDNSSPDIDAEHLNKPEQAIKRVTDALNSAVDVIKDLQSQVTKNAGDISTVNNNLSNPDRINLNVLIEKTSLNSPERTGVYYVTGDNIGALPSGFSNYGILLCMRSPYSLHPTNSNCVYVQEYTDVYGKHASRSSNNGAWTNWTTTATKSDLTDIIMVKSFRGTSITVAGNASEKISIPISTPTGYKVVGKISEWWNNGPEMYLSQVDLTPTTFTGYAANLKNSEATSIPTISVLFVKS